MSHESTHENTPQNTPNQRLVIGLAVVGGIGFTLLTVAIAIGVTQAEAANNSVIGLLFWGGVILLVGATGAWFGVVQPQKHFDDINKPLYTGHHEKH
ncbi:MAG: hypothetical protein ACOYL5_05495 [Phototrophicaceae bacterium]|jgi:hypothetical protein